MAIEQRASSVTRRRPRIGPRLGQVHIGLWRLIVGIVLVAAWAVIARLAGQNFVPSPLQTLTAGI